MEFGLRTLVLSSYATTSVPLPLSHCTVSSEFGDPQPAASSLYIRDYSTQQRF